MEKIDLYIGDDYTFTLPGLGNAGYLWEYSLEGDEHSIAVSIAPTDLLPQNPPGCLPPDTFNLDTQVTVTAIAPGRVTMYFEFRRPWERQVPALKAKTLAFIID